jgi:hypothetical protein
MKSENITLNTSLRLVGLGISLVVLNGCAGMQVKLGMKVNLATIPVASMNVRLANRPGIAPGEKIPLVVTLTEPNGKVWQTEGAGRSHYGDV